MVEVGLAVFRPLAAADVDTVKPSMEDVRMSRDFLLESLLWMHT